MVRYFEKGRFEVIGEIEERGTTRRYIYFQVLKYLNLLHFFFQKEKLDVFPHKNLGDSQFRAICYLVLYLSVIEKRSINWISKKVLRQWDATFNFEFIKKFRTIKLIALHTLLEKYPPLERLSILYAHPLFLVEKLASLVPEEELEDLLRAHNTQRFLYFRLMRNAVDPMYVRNYFHTARVPIKKVKGLGIVFQFLRRNIQKVVRSSLYSKGDIALHDLASIQTCIVLDPQPGDLILDTCAAPLMKTSFLRLISREKCDLISIDISLSRFLHSRILENNQTKISLINADATNLPFRQRGADGIFDKVLVDAPCSSSGAIYYSPEMKWFQTPEYVRSHVNIQQKLLQESLRYLRPKGILIYSVCSYYREEGEEIIEGASNQTKIVQTRRFFPHKDKCQGFFVAKLEKQ